MMNILFRIIIPVAAVLLLIASCKLENHKNAEVTVTKQSILPDSLKWQITTPPDSLHYHFFYKQYVLVNGIPVICSHKVTKEAIYKACNIIDYMTKLLPDSVLAEMVRRNARLGIMWRYEGTTDIPEHAYLAEDTTMNWDVRARGLGADTTSTLTTCAEENLLGLVSDKYHAEDITIHEFAHAIHSLGIEPLDKTFNQKLQTALDNALAEGRWVNTYAGSNLYEYWAEGVQSWFNVNVDVPEADGTHSPINTRSELKEYDPELYNIIADYFPETTDLISSHAVPYK